eukprot:CAMPEP_0197026152 /NCGR_PEP_ID=MMETSP1384-20130603/6313_1 /TAXON_ID=29189 /ORGANISM="Ammonia sp." /LENGTH=695 /DNA_ID=CAMNT_0042454769 /DNA_START=9 /DNA_END=2096 /DNA_ORIENTATION=+
MSALLFVFVVCINAQNIQWFQSSTAHLQNIQQLKDGWTECPEWQTLSASESISFPSIIPSMDIPLPPKNNTLFNFTSHCITLQVPLNWDDPSESNNTIDYHVSRIYSGFDVNNTKNRGSFWMLQGGPGGSGSSLYALAIPFMNYLNDTFDVYLPDHRGTGKSNSLDCPSNITSFEHFLQCVNTLDDTYGDDLHHFSTYQASMDLGYVVDLFHTDLSVYSGTNDIIYGVSYGTYWLNQYLLLFPDQCNAAILDSMLAPDLLMFAQNDLDFHSAGIDLLQKCDEQPFCRQLFAEMNTQIVNATSRIFDELLRLENGQEMEEQNECIELMDSYNMNATALRGMFALTLMDPYLNVFIPPYIYRATRCNQDDMSAFMHLFTVGLPAIQRALMNQTDSGVAAGLFFNVALGDLWPYDDSNPGPSYSEYMEEETGYFFSTGLTPTLRVLWDEWNRYTPKADIWRKYADPPIPLLLMGGDLDPQTHISQGLHAAAQYGANIDDTTTINEQDRYFVTFPNALHGAIISTPMTNQSADIEYELDGLQTCGMYVIRSFVDPQNEYVPDTACIPWMQDIDWSGDTATTKMLSLFLTGTADLWGQNVSQNGNVSANISTSTATITTQSVDAEQESTEMTEKETWFIVSIVFIVIFAISIGVIGYLGHHMCCTKQKREKVPPSKRGYQQTGQQEDVETGTLNVAEDSD